MNHVWRHTLTQNIISCLKSSYHCHQNIPPCLKLHFELSDSTDNKVMRLCTWNLLLKSTLIFRLLCQSMKSYLPLKDRMERKCPYWRPTRHTPPWRISNQRASMWLRHYYVGQIMSWKNGTRALTFFSFIPVVSQAFLLCVVWKPAPGLHYCNVAHINLFLQGSLWSLWPLVVLLNRFSVSRSSFCLSCKCAHWSTGGGNMSRKTLMHQQRQWRRRLIASKHGCTQGRFQTFQENRLCRCFMVKEMHSSCLLDPKDTHNEFW